MNPVLLDTHALVWLLEDHSQLGRRAARMADAAARTGILLVSAITFWEVALLAMRRRLTLAQTVAGWRRRVLDLGIEEIPVSGDIGILSAELEGFPADPADRIIVASALGRGATLITADEGILDHSDQVPCHDARR
jgi:PIN domain nuclease of toxin-antitoxin system